MDFAYVEGERKPMVIYKPYIYATIYDCHTCYAIERNNKVKIIDKKTRKEIRVPKD